MLEVFAELMGRTCGASKVRGGPWVVPTVAVGWRQRATAGACCAMHSFHNAALRAPPFKLQQHKDLCRHPFLRPP